MKLGWLVVLFYGISTLFRSFNTKFNFKQFSLELAFVEKWLNV